MAGKLKTSALIMFILCHNTVMNEVCRPLEEESSFCPGLLTCTVIEIVLMGLIPRFLLLITIVLMWFLEK